MITDRLSRNLFTYFVRPSPGQLGEVSQIRVIRVDIEAPNDAGVKGVTHRIEPVLDHLLHLIVGYVLLGVELKSHNILGVLN